MSGASEMRAALVTGGSRGIGRAIAETLGQEGYALTLVARQPEKLEWTAKELRTLGYDVQPVAGDLADEAAIKNAVARHRERFGRLDVLVNNAGIGYLRLLENQSTEEVDAMYAVNLRAMILLYRECAEMLRAAGREHHNALVVNISSVSGIGGEAWLSGYSATKAGMIGFTEAMNQELNAAGIKSVALCPGYVDTDMTAPAKEEGFPAEEMLVVGDVAEAVRFTLKVSPKCLVPEIVLRRLSPAPERA